MIGLMLMTHNKREGQILKMAFEQLHVKVIVSSPSYANYVKSLQYMPDVIIMELPRTHQQEVQFSELIRKNKRTQKVPIIGYGNTIPEGMKTSLSKNGISNYMNRPLKFSLLMTSIQKYLAQVNKAIDDFPAKDTGEKDEDVRLILDPSTLPVKKIELMVKHISGLMAFPFTVAKVLKLAGSEKSGANDLAKVIEADPVISANILKVSNTVFFASANRRISSVKDAIVRIGFTETKRITMAMGVMDSVGAESNSFGFDRMKFWMHSLSTAIISERIAKRLGGISTDEAFLAGLLHDFGIILLDEFFPTIFQKILEKTTDNASRFIAAERNLITITHNDVVRELFDNWKLPSSTSEAITSHYSILKTEKRFTELNDKISMCVEIGNILSKCYHNGEGTDQYVYPIENWVFSSLKMPSGPNKDFFKDIENELTMYMKFLKIEEEKEIKNSAFVKSIGFYCSGTRAFNTAEAYLISQGHEVTRINPSEEGYSEHDQKYDAIVIGAEKEMTEEEFKPLSMIIKKPIEEGSEEKPENAPYLITTYSDSVLAQSKDLQLMFNVGDLRMIDENLSKVIEGKKVERGESPSTQTPPSSSDSNITAADLAAMNDMDNDLPDDSGVESSSEGPVEETEEAPM